MLWPNDDDDELVSNFKCIKGDEYDSNDNDSADNNSNNDSNNDSDNNNSKNEDDAIGDDDSDIAMTIASKNRQTIIDTTQTPPGSTSEPQVTIDS